MGLDIKGKLKELKDIGGNADIVFMPEIHPDGLVLHYSTNYEYKSEVEDLLHSNENVVVLPNKIRTYFRKEYGVVDLNNIMYENSFKQWPQYWHTIIRGLSNAKIKKIKADIERGAFIVLDYLSKQEGYCINTILYPTFDKKEEGIRFCILEN